MAAYPSAVYNRQRPLRFCADYLEGEITLKRNALFRFYFLLLLEVMSANMVHPVTPSFLTGLGMPSYMFGAAFAAMSLTNFLLCPFWGGVGDLHSRVKTMSFTTYLYAFGQILFFRSTTAWQIILARLFSGAFSGGTTVCFMAYVADVAGEKDCGKQMAICAALTSAGTAIGYLVGGVLGDISIRTAFYSQALLLTLSATGMLLLLREGPYYQKGTGSVLKALNPFGIFFKTSGFFSGPVAVFLITVFLGCFASTAYDNAFNYYLKDQFQFPPSYNGYIYATIGVVGIAVNMTVGLYLQRKTNCRTPLILIFCGAFLTLMASLLTRGVLSYIAVNMIFYLCNSMYLPLQQALALTQCRADHGTVSGIFSSVRAMGMVTGSLSAGLLYSFTPLMPMAVCAGVFLLTAFFTWVNLKQQRRNS